MQGKASNVGRSNRSQNRESIRHGLVAWRTIIPFRSVRVCNRHIRDVQACRLRDEYCTVNLFTMGERFKELTILSSVVGNGILDGGTPFAGSAESHTAGVVLTCSCLVGGAIGGGKPTFLWTTTSRERVRIGKGHDVGVIWDHFLRLYPQLEQ